MKKLISLLAVLVLAVSVSLADTYNSGVSTFGVGGTFYCVPVLTPPLLPVTIGNFFTSNLFGVPIPGTPSVNWSLIGDPAATYQLTVTDPVNVLGTGAGIPQIHGTWTYASAGGYYPVGHLWWSTGFGGVVETPGSGVAWPTLGGPGPQADLSCTIPSVFTFTAKTVDTGTMPGVHTFNISVSVIATI